MSHYKDLTGNAVTPQSSATTAPLSGEPLKSAERKRRQTHPGKNLKEWHEELDPKIIELHRQGMIDDEIAAAVGVSSTTVRKIRYINGLQPNTKSGKPFRGPSIRFNCVHPDCKYSAVNRGEYRCDYLGMTGKSRVLYHRQRGLSEEIVNCQCYESGKRKSQIKPLSVPAKSEPWAATTGRVKKIRKHRREPEIKRELKEMPNRLSPEREAERMELYNAGLTDTKIAKKQGVNTNSIMTWRERRGLPSQSDKEREKKQAVFRKLFEAGFGIAECAKLVGRDKRTLRAWRDEMDLTREPVKSGRPTDEMLREREKVLEELGLWSAEREVKAAAERMARQCT